MDRQCNNHCRACLGTVTGIDLADAFSAIEMADHREWCNARSHTYSFIFAGVFNLIFMTRWFNLISLPALMTNITAGLFGTFEPSPPGFQMGFNDEIRA